MTASSARGAQRAGPAHTAPPQTHGSLPRLAASFLVGNKGPQARAPNQRQSLTALPTPRMQLAGECSRLHMLPSRLAPRKSASADCPSLPPALQPLRG